MHVEVDTEPDFRHPKSRGSAPASAATDFTAQLTVDRLQPGTRYWYRVWFSGAGGHGRSDVAGSVSGTFKTAPAVSDSDALSFVIAADVGGQRYCRNAAAGGYAIFGAMQRLAPDFAIVNGDAIYGDGDCPVAGGEPGWINIPGDFPSIADPAVDWTNVDAVREIYRQHWRYNRADPYTQSFLRTTPVIAQWDDHEVINDFGAPWTYWNSANIDRAGYPNIVDAGRDTFFAYSPVARHAAERDRVYRAFRWGRDLEIFVLDARSYRDRNDALDTGPEPKVTLGPEQVAWLVEGIQRSTATTWKVVSSDVPHLDSNRQSDVRPRCVGAAAWRAADRLPPRTARSVVRARSYQCRERRVRRHRRPLRDESRLRRGRQWGRRCPHAARSRARSAQRGQESAEERGAAGSVGASDRAVCGGEFLQLWFRNRAAAC
jgi:alkaline phosphatase D